MRDLEHTINVLATAYLQGEFNPLHGCCCTVGNIVADSCGYTIVNDNMNWVDSEGEEVKVLWADHFCLGEMRTNPIMKPLWPGALEQIEPTGYTAEELCSLERAMFVGMGKYLFDSPEGYATYVGGYQAFSYEGERCEYYNIDYKADKEQVHFHGLMAVVDKLFEIHGVKDEQELELAKKQFDPLADKVIM